MSAKTPVFLLAGGRGRTRPTPDPLIQAVYKNAGLSAPRVAYVGTANDDSPDFFQRMADYFKENGAAGVSHARMRRAGLEITRARAMLEAADIVFISGGDVEYGMRVLKNMNMADFLSGLYAAGKPFFGVSAGSIMLGQTWVKWPEDEKSEAVLFPCLGIAPVTCDTHGEDDDFEELQTALTLAGEDASGYGIVSGTAIKVTPDGIVQAIGGPTYRYVNQGGKIKRMADLTPGK
jgi:cyanophycinase-like exopeptidase